MIYILNYRIYETIRKSFPYSCAFFVYVSGDYLMEQSFKLSLHINEWLRCFDAALSTWAPMPAHFDKWCSRIRRK